MSTTAPPPQTPNALGKASLVLGILASTFVFMVGLCAGVGKQQGWLPAVGPLLFVLGGTFSFMGLVSALLGFGGLWGRHRSRAAAFFGMLLGIATVLLFLTILDRVK